MAKKDVKVGDHVEFLRSHNKAVKLAGTVVKVHEGSPVVDVQLDDHAEGWVETAHIDDVTVTEEPKKKATKKEEPKKD